MLGNAEYIYLQSVNICYQQFFSAFSFTLLCSWAAVFHRYGIFRGPHRTFGPSYVSTWGRTRSYYHLFMKKRTQMKFLLHLTGAFEPLSKFKRWYRNQERWWGGIWSVLRNFTCFHHSPLMPSLHVNCSTRSSIPAQVQLFLIPSSECHWWSLYMNLYIKSMYLS